MAGESSSHTTLESAIKENNIDTIIKSLGGILLDVDKQEFKDIGTIKQLLNLKNTDVLKPTAQWIAELAKSAENRAHLTDPDIIKILLCNLSNDTPGACNVELCRALANICCENSAANKHLTDLGALDTLVKFIDSNVHSENTELLNVCFGFLLNHLTENPDGQKKAIDLNILSIIEKVLAPRISNINTCETLFLHILFILSLLSENLSETWFSNELCLHLVHLLELSTNPNISELCLDILTTEGENDDIKSFLAKESLCELLFNLLEKHKDLVQDAEGRALLKSACGLIVLILTGDESMTYLYNDGHGKVYSDMLSWLNSDDVDLLSTAVLAIGNFARNDSHCIDMVENGISEILLRILSKHNDVNSDVRLQHALLSALRNLVIPSANKARLISEGLIDIIYPLISTSQQIVVFKLLGTLRLLIDGQAETAVNLAMRVELLEKLVEWSFTSDHTGVRAESLRLLAWLIKHCRSAEPFPVLLRVDRCLRCLVEMLASPHALMQNEAVLALNILCAAHLADNNINQTDSQKLNSAKQRADDAEQAPAAKLDLGRILLEDDVAKYLTFLLSRHADHMEAELLENLVHLLEYLVQITLLKEHLKRDELLAALRALGERDALSHLSDRVKHVLSCIESS